MNREQAKQILPMFQAWVEGKTIQYKNQGEPWVDYVKGDAIWWETTTVERRIKPEKKTGWLNLYRTDSCSDGSFSNVYITKELADNRAASNRIACIQIEYEEGEGL